MFSSIRDRFGTAGMIVAIVALVAALGGSAYAANAALSGKQKKEVKKIAKEYAGKPGAPGANGTNGSNGAQGAKGDKGDAGTTGTNGTNGVSPKGTTFTGSKGSCTEGGIEYVGASTNFVCNGEAGPEGSPWTVDGVLPSEKTETGAWAAAYEEVGSFVPLSFTIPLPDALDEDHVIKLAATYNGEGEATEEEENCPGKASDPKAAPGFLCVYLGGDVTATTVIEKIFDPAVGSAGPSGAATSGAALILGTPGFGSGTWAVTAP
jgi:hypothetical protein